MQTIFRIDLNPCTQTTFNIEILVTHFKQLVYNIYAVWYFI